MEEHSDDPCPSGFRQSKLTIFKSRKQTSGARKLLPLIQYLLSKHEDLGSIPRTHKNPGVVECALILLVVPSRARHILGDPWPVILACAEKRE